MVLLPARSGYPVSYILLDDKAGLLILFLKVVSVSYKVIVNGGFVRNEKQRSLILSLQAKPVSYKLYEIN